MGRAVGAAAGRALRPRPAGARRQQRRHRRAHRPTSTSPCAASPSPPWAPPASAARRCAACSSTTASTTRCVPRLKAAYASVPVGDPREAGTLVGPLIDAARLRRHAARAGRRAQAAGGAGHWRRARRGRPAPDALLRRARRWSRCRRQTDVVRRETFAPILYVMRYADLDDAIAPAERRAAGPVVVDLHQRPARGRALLSAARLRLRHRQRQHRPLGRRDRRRVRRREGNRRRPRGRLRRLEGLHAPRHQHGQLRRAPCRWPRASSSTSGPTPSIERDGTLASAPEGRCTGDRADPRWLHRDRRVGPAALTSG